MDAKLINVTYKRENYLIADNISAEFPGNSLTGILGPVEDRVSYILKMIGGIIQPLKGDVIVGGENLYSNPAEEHLSIRKKIAFVFERGGIISNLNIRENLRLPLDYVRNDLSEEQKQELIAQYFDQFEIPLRVLEERPARLHRQLTKLILLIRAFIINPELILYDNPFVDLEIPFKKKILLHILKLKNTGKITQIFLANSDNLFEMSDNNFVFFGGKIIEQGTWSDLIQSSNVQTQKLIKEYLEIGINETSL